MFLMGETVERQHLTYKEPVVAGDIFRHSTLAKKKSCLRHTDETLQRFYSFNVRYARKARHNFWPRQQFSRMPSLKSSPVAHFASFSVWFQLPRLKSHLFKFPTLILFFSLVLIGCWATAWRTAAWGPPMPGAAAGTGSRRCTGPTCSSASSSPLAAASWRLRPSVLVASRIGGASFAMEKVGGLFCQWSNTKVLELILLFWHVWVTLPISCNCNLQL